jgi:sec-independent protein translocase protein TatA
MFGSLGMPELVIIFVIALIVFGPRKLPELGKSLGKSLAEFKRASNELRNSLEEEIRVEEEREKPRPAPTPAPVVAAAPTPDASPAPAAVSDDPYTDDLYDRAQDEAHATVPETTPRGANL